MLRNYKYEYKYEHKYEFLCISIIGCVQVCFAAIWAPSWKATYLSKTHFKHLGLKIVIRFSASAFSVLFVWNFVLDQNVIE